MEEKSKNCCQKLPLEFHYQNYKIVFIFLLPLFGVLYNKIRWSIIEDENTYFVMHLYFISYLFSSVPVLIDYIISRRKKKLINEENNNNLKKNEVVIANQKISLLQFSKKPKIFSLKGIMIITILCGSSIGYRYFDFEGYEEKKTIGLSYKIAILFLLSHLILKYKYYKHHYYTFLFNLLVLITKYIIALISKTGHFGVGKDIWFYFFFALFHSILLVFGKYFMDKYNINPYTLMFIIGITNICIFIVIATLRYLITSESDVFSGYTEYITSNNTFLLFIADIISQFFYNLGSWITVYYFTPLHTIISENAIEIYYNVIYIKGNLENLKGKYLLMSAIYIALVINIICSLIFNEIIILKFCKCDYYTRIRIEEREKEESKNFLEFDDKDDNDESEKINEIIPEDGNEPEIL